jgi:hypothetical protein
MSIRFPKMHIAASVVNRILNAHDEIQSGRAAAAATRAPQDEPSPPDPNLEGTMLNMQLMQPPAPSEAPDDQTADAIALKAGGLL